MSVRKRKWETPSGEPREAWVVTYRDKEGIQRQGGTFALRRDAADCDNRIKMELKKGVHQPTSVSPTLREIGRLWLASMEGTGLERKVINNRKQLLSTHVYPATVLEDVPHCWNGQLGDVKLATVTTPMCVVFQRALPQFNARTTSGKVIEDRFISRATAKNVLVMLKAVLNEAQARGVISYNPASGLTLKIRDRDRRPLRIGYEIPDRSDVRVLFEASVGMWRILTATAAFSGLRASELRGLPWEHVDIKKKIIHVWQRADAQRNIGRCKSGAAYRDVPISDFLVNLLVEWRRYCPTTDEGLVFPAVDGGVLSHEEILQDCWYPLLKRVDMQRAGGGNKYKFHGLRHFYASLMIDEGLSAKRLQVRMGHSSIKITMDVYGHLFPDDDDDDAVVNRAAASVIEPVAA